MMWPQRATSSARSNRRSGSSRWVRHLRFILEHPMSPDRHGSWMPVIRAAAKRFHLNPSSLRHMMMLESGGRTYCVTGPFLGLFQYCRGTWNGAWKQFRSYGIFNGGAQIWATATAIHRGWGHRCGPTPTRCRSARPGERTPASAYDEGGWPPAAPSSYTDADHPSAGRSGGTGRRAGLKIRFPTRECGFKSHLRHQLLGCTGRHPRSSRVRLCPQTKPVLALSADNCRHRGPLLCL